MPEQRKGDEGNHVCFKGEQNSKCPLKNFADDFEFVNNDKTNVRKNRARRYSGCLNDDRISVSPPFPWEFWVKTVI